MLRYQRWLWRAATYSIFNYENKGREICVYSIKKSNQFCENPIMLHMCIMRISSFLHRGYRLCANPGVCIRHCAYISTYIHNLLRTLWEVECWMTNGNLRLQDQSFCQLWIVDVPHSDVCLCMTCIYYIFNINPHTHTHLFSTLPSHDLIAHSMCDC